MGQTMCVSSCAVVFSGHLFRERFASFEYERHSETNKRRV